jgi:hypothetical protein
MGCMNTFLPVRATKMTTPELIRACAQQDVIVTVTKLARWVREGLIPDSLRQRHGLGQGNGTEWLWDVECLPRAVIIGRSLSNDRSLFHAARALAETGYAPSSTVLSKVLIDCMEIFQRPMMVRQTYIGSGHPQKEQYKRFIRHMRQKMSDMPDSTFDPFSAYIAALLGLIPDDVPVLESMRQMQHVFSPLSLKECLETVDGSMLLTMYDDAGRMIPTLVPLIVGMFNEFLLPLVKQLQEKRGQNTAALPARIDLQMRQECMLAEGERLITSNLGIGRFRLYLTIFLTVLPSDSEKLGQWTAALLSLLCDISEYFGFPRNIVTSLLEVSKKNNPEEKGPAFKL